MIELLLVRLVELDRVPCWGWGNEKGASGDVGVYGPISPNRGGQIGVGDDGSSPEPLEVPCPVPALCRATQAQVEPLVFVAVVEGDEVEWLDVLDGHKSKDQDALGLVRVHLAVGVAGVVDEARNVAALCSICGGAGVSCVCF